VYQKTIYSTKNASVTKQFGHLDLRKCQSWQSMKIRMGLELDQLLVQLT